VVVSSQKTTEKNKKKGNIKSGAKRRAVFFRGVDLGALNASAHFLPSWVELC